MSEDKIPHRDRVHGLFVTHTPQIRGYVLGLMPNMIRADDVLQETFLTVSSKADDFVIGTNFIAWVFSIARYKVLEECNRSSKNNCLLSPDVIQAVCAGDSSMMEDDHDLQIGALRKCMSSLSPHTRRAVDLRYSRAHSTPEPALFTKRLNAV